MQNKKLSVLIVDDNSLMLRQVDIILRQLGVEQISFAEDGMSALSQIDGERRIDVILLDLNMPDMDGVEVMRHLAMRGYQGGIALFSGEDSRILRTAESLASVHQLNVIGALSKPVTRLALQNTLASFQPQQTAKNFNAIEPVTVEELQFALDKLQIEPFYQPKVRVPDKRLRSVEVLARWRHPEKGIIPPIAFIPVAEEQGLIDRLTNVVINQAAETFGRWLAAGFDFNLGMNICADSLAHVELPENLAAIAKRHSVPCERIELEITESRLVQNLKTSLDVLTRLRLKGFGLAIDDFGTGYSSMSQLSHVPFTELKIDRAFVHDAHKDSAAYAILESAVELAKKLDMVTVAEGVENARDWQTAADIGCDLAQGYFIAKPMPAADLDRWLHEQKRS